MAWTIELSKEVRKDLRKLDKQIAVKILAYLHKNIEGCLDPTEHGKHLSGDLSNLHRYRVGDYRIVCMIEYDRLVVVAIAVSHRKDVYKKLILK